MLSSKRRQIHGAFTTWKAMSRNGAWIGTAPTPADSKLTHRGPPPIRSAIRLSAGALGTALNPIADQPDAWDLASVRFFMISFLVSVSCCPVLEKQKLKQ